MNNHKRTSKILSKLLILMIVLRKILYRGGIRKNEES